MRRLTLRSLFLAITVCSIGNGQAAWAVILANGSNLNTTAASLQTYLNGTNPGVPAPSFDNVGVSTNGTGSVVYLGNRWILTAAHVNTDSNVGSVRFGSNFYGVDNSSITLLTSPNGTAADLKLVRLTSDPGLPSIPASMISSSLITPASRVLMIGNGLNTDGVERYWNYSITFDINNQPVYTWTEQGSQPAIPVPGTDFSGFNVTGGNTIRWGENMVFNSALIMQTAWTPSSQPAYTTGFSTKFDKLAYTHTIPLGNEADATKGDSGGAVFSLSGGQWKLSGIMTATFSGNPVGPANTDLYGNQTAIQDLSLFRSQIMAVVPEPGSFVLAAMGAVALAVIRRRQRSAGK